MTTTLGDRLAQVANNSTLRLTHYGRRSGKLYEVTIWFMVEGENIYLATTNRKRQWPRNVAVHPEITLRIGNETFTGRVEEATDRVTIEHVTDLLVAKYWYTWPYVALARFFGCQVPSAVFRVFGADVASLARCATCHARSRGGHMKPKIDRTQFGSITIDGSVFEHDVILRLGGQVKKRKKKLSKRIYGTSHTISLDEARHVYQKGAARLIIGAGQHGTVTLSDEAAAYFKRKECSVDLEPTPIAARSWNESKGAVLGLFHVTC